MLGNALALNAWWALFSSNSSGVFNVDRLLVGRFAFNRGKSSNGVSNVDRLLVGRLVFKSGKLSNGVSNVDQLLVGRLVFKTGKLSNGVSNGDRLLVGRFAFNKGKSSTPLKAPNPALFQSMASIPSAGGDTLGCCTIISFKRTWRRFDYLHSRAEAQSLAFQVC